MQKAPRTTGEELHGTLSLAGGAAAESETVNSITTNDVIVGVTVKTVTNAVYLKTVAISAKNTITYTFSGDPGAATVTYLIRKQGS